MAATGVTERLPRLRTVSIFITISVDVHRLLLGDDRQTIGVIERKLTVAETAANSDIVTQYAATLRPEGLVVETSKQRCIWIAPEQIIGVRLLRS